MLNIEDIRIHAKDDFFTIKLKALDIIKEKHGSECVEYNTTQEFAEFVAYVGDQLAYLLSKDSKNVVLLENYKNGRSFRSPTV